MAQNVLTHNLSLPLNGTKTATVDINTDSGNLTIDRLTSGDQLLASGTLPYFEKQGIPIQTLSSSDGQARTEEWGYPATLVPLALGSLHRSIRVEDPHQSRGLL